MKNTEQKEQGSTLSLFDASYNRWDNGDAESFRELNYYQNGANNQSNNGLGETHYQQIRPGSTNAAEDVSRQMFLEADNWDTDER